MHRLASPVLVVLGLLACTPADPGDTTTTDDSTAPGSSTEPGAGTSTEDPTTTAPAPDLGDDPATTAGATGTDTEPAEVCGDEPLVDGCCCFTVTGEDGHGVLGVTCPATPALCEAPQATCPEDQTDCGTDALMPTDPANLDCALQALSTGAAGLVQWGVSSEDGLGGATGYIYLLGDGTALVYSYDFYDAEYSYADVARVQLQDAAYFDDCAGASDPERFECVRKATVGEPLELCVPGFMGTIGEP